MNDQNYIVLSKVIGAVETGGQVYGNARYNAYVPPYTNTPKEHTITLGWAQNYGASAEKLISMIYRKDSHEFEKLDTATPSISSMLGKDWSGMRWNPNSSQKKALIALIDSEVGHQCQDELFAEDMKKFVADCESKYTSDVKAIMMYCEIRHLGGKTPTERIFDRCIGNYSVDSIMNSLQKDQNDTSNSNQVGDKKYWSRHVKCAEFVNKYALQEFVYTKKEVKPVGFKKYNLTESQLKKIARLCQQEQGTVTGAKAEASLMANQLETSKTRQNKYGTGADGLYNWVRNGGWYSKAAYWMDNGELASSILSGVRDVLVNGNRTLPQYVDEHDCLSDIKSISTGSVRDKSAYIKGKTIVKNSYGSTWTFYCFPDSYSDPFGYTAEAYKYVNGQSKTEEKKEETPTVQKATEKTIKICGHGSGNPSTKVMYNYLEERYNKYMSNGGRKGIVCVKRLKSLTDAERQKFHDTYKTILGRNIYSQDLRSYCYTPYSNGKYYSDCSSSGMRTFAKINSAHNGLKDFNTQAIYESGQFENVAVTIKNGHITNPEVLKVGDCLLFAGNLSRPKYIGHVEYVYEISGSTTPSKTEPETTLNETSKWTGYVTADALNVRTWAGTENATCSFSPLNYQTAVGVCDNLKASDGNTWYYILYNGKHGFVSAKYISSTKPADKPKEDATEAQNLMTGTAAKVGKQSNKEKWKYGDSGSVIPCADGKISCDRLVARTLWDIGYKDQPRGGYTINNGLFEFLERIGFKKTMKKSEIKPGAVVAVGNGSIEHVFIVETYNQKTDLCRKYDAGSDDRIKKACYFANVKLVEWSNRKFIAAWNVPSNLKGTKKKEEPKKEESGTSVTTWHGVDYSPVYNFTYYKKKYKDLQEAFGNDKDAYFKHFCEHGMHECRKASSNFDVKKYKAKYEDLQKAFGNDWPKYYEHYCVHGRFENRKAK